MKKKAKQGYLSTPPTHRYCPIDTASSSGNQVGMTDETPVGRTTYTDKSTIGKLYINGVFKCFA